MQSAEFVFARPWIHRGVPYQPGEVASLPDCDAHMLAEAGAGEVRRPTVDDAPRRRSRAQSTEPPT